MNDSEYRDITIRVYRGRIITVASCRICGALSPDQTACGARKMRRQHMRDAHQREGS